MANLNQRKPIAQGDLDRIGGAIIRAAGALIAGDVTHAASAIADAQLYLAQLRELAADDD